MAVSGTMTASALNGVMELVRDELEEAADALGLTWSFPMVLERRDLTSASDISLRSRVFIPYDDHPAAMLICQGLAASGTQAVSARLEAVTSLQNVTAKVIKGRLPNDVIEAAAASIGTGAVVDARKIYAPGAAPYPALLAGTPYRLSLDVTSAGTLAMARAVLCVGTRWRR